MSGAAFGGARAVPLVVLAALALGAGCGGASGNVDDGKPRVVASYSILGDLVQNVGGDAVELETLVGPDGDAHTFEPAPSDNARLSEADVIFENGLEFEGWMDDLYESSDSEAQRVVASEGVEPLELEEHGHEDEEHGEEEEHGEVDPHVWHDPNNAMVMVENVREALVEADPDNAEVYERNAEEYVARLEDLDAEVAAEVEEIPEEKRVLFTSHDTFGYFARRYGFEVDTALGSLSTEAADPSAARTAELVEEIEGSGVSAIFAENVSNPDLMGRISREADVELAPTLYTDALGTPGTEGDTYIRMVRYNARTIAEALGG